MSRKLVRKLTVVAIVVGTLISPIALKPMLHGFGGTKEVVVAKGVIDNKRSIDYECGTSKNRQTCTDHMLSINGKEHSVNSETFHNYTEQQHITLVQTKNNRSAYWWEMLLLWYSMISFIISFTVFLVTFMFFLYWCLFSDTKKNFKDWFMET